MAVVINEMDITAEPPAPPPARPPQPGRGGGAQQDPQKAAKEINQILRVTAERRLRLRAH